jgi:hypothetical protein
MGTRQKKILLSRKGIGSKVADKVWLSINRLEP